LNKFIDAVYEDNIIKLFKYLSRVNKSVKKMEIRSQNFVNPNLFKNWFDGAIEELSEYAIKKGYELQIKDIGSIGKSYFLKKINAY
jgi:hypothetical protein